MELKPSYRYDIAMLRLISIIVIVFFHAYGMTYVHFSEEVNAQYSLLYEAFNQSYLINLAMPLFVVISGYLFGGQLKKNKYKTIKELTIAKFKRIMLPFFAFTLFFMITTNSFSFKPFYQWTYWHLWFLPMLFWCFVLSYALKNVLLRKNEILTCVTLLIVFAFATVERFIPMYLGLHNITLWYCWFVFGIKMNQYSEILYNYIRKFHLIIIIIASYLLLCINFYREYGSSDWVGILTTLAGIIAISYISHEINWTKIKCLPSLVYFSSLSFGIYIYHNWLEMYMVSNTAKRLLGIETFAAQHVYLFPVIFSLSALAVSTIATILTLKTKIGRYLIG